MSACISSALAANYAVKLSHTEDKSYHGFLMAIFSYPEIAFGILAVCLPIVPKFVNSLQNSHWWFRVNSFFHSIIHFKIDPRTFDAQSDKSSAAKLDDGWNSLHAPLTNSKSLPDEVELATTNNRNGESAEETHEMRHSQPLQILRTVHIATTHEVASASMMAGLDNQASSMAYASRRH